MEDREPANLWAYTSKRPKHLFYAIKKGLFKHPYFWHDSFGRYVNRFLFCRLFGHRKIRNISDDKSKAVLYCFACEQYIKEDSK